MLITTRPVKFIRGKTSDAFCVTNVSGTVLIPESEEDRDAIEVFIKQHVPTIED